MYECYNFEILSSLSLWILINESWNFVWIVVLQLLKIEQLYMNMTIHLISSIFSRPFYKEISKLMDLHSVPDFFAFTFAVVHDDGKLLSKKQHSVVQNRDQDNLSSRDNIKIECM